MEKTASQDVRSAIADAVASVANDTSVPGLNPGNQNEVKAALQAELGPVILSERNLEPWYQSKVTLGNVSAIIAAGIGIGALVQSGSTDATLYATAVLTIAGNAFSLYGRWVARRPIGA